MEFRRTPERSRVRLGEEFRSTEKKFDSFSIYSALEPINSPRKDIESKSTLAYTATGEALTDYGRTATKEDFEFGVMFWKLAGKLLEQGKLKVHPLSVRPNGLRGVLEGLKEMREGKVSGEKLVYKIADTP